ncbi:hypothetical protein BDA96_01G199700 [Sorghum bicolor]|uniref:J domain-containing protein n=2 Tax=Sorghum bicolor TaxID=4558 RepID=A0A921RZU6_SORBI|nr:atherin [Sorghum bicolor]EER93918.1 hypothetical protein SORBI_3001G189800 [Sorghum bicolor]KAG0548811.1 hypothetical protein BDA96_01G199700 [Sorghum bicolor]|eukprot:XP_002466920.1 atherin [Sorghum bicolor]
MADSSVEKEKEEQARKAHALAEKCFLAGNVSAARQWMQSAVRLAPDLPGTPQIVAAYDVHAAAARSTRNWYAVLDLKPGRSLTHDDIKKQYRRLCLLVHPDKNPSAAADGAFKLIQAAWDALLAKHPPLGTAAAPAPAANQPAPPPPAAQRQQAAPPRPPEPKPKPKPQPRPPRRRPAPQTTPRPAAPKPPTNSQQANPKQDGKCSNCGATSLNGRNNYRCMSCLWSPMDGRHELHDDDDDDDFYYY